MARPVGLSRRTGLSSPHSMPESSILSRRRFEDDDKDDDWDNDSWDDDLDEDLDDDTIPCPHCRRQIHEDAERCPYCEQYLSDEDTVRFTKPGWVIVTALVLLYVMYRSIAGGW